MAKKSSYKTGGMSNPNRAKVSPAPKGIGPSSAVKKFKGGGPTSYKGKAAPVAKVASVSKTGVMKKGGTTKKYGKGGASKARDAYEKKKIPSTTYNPNRKAPGVAENKLAVVRNDKGIKELASQKTTPVKTTTVAKKTSTKSSYPKVDKNYVNPNQKPVIIPKEDAIKVAEGMDKKFNTTEYTDRLKEQMGRTKSTPIETNKMSMATISSPTPTMKTIPTVSTKQNPVAMKKKRKKNMGGTSSKKAGILSGMDYGMPEENSGILSMKKGGMPKKAKGGSAHPGFKAVQNKIASKQGISKQAAGAILASSTRNASKAAKRKNPRLNRVKG